METKNFLFSLVILSLAAQLLTGCNTFQRRNRVQTEPLPVKTEPGQASPVLQSNGKGTTDVSTPQVIPAPVNPSPGQVLPVGVFLGPGAIRTFSEIGVLRALQRAQVPIVAIGGMEWGSIIAASYALSRGANEVEWQMMKLKKEQLPSSSMLHREIVANDVDPLFDFLKSVFGDKDLSSGTLPFRCSTTDGEETVFISQGKAREQLIRCAVLPPLYNFYDRAGKKWVSGAVNPGDWPSELRKMGAQFIIYVDVINHGNLLSAQKYAGDTQVRALWIALKSISKQQHLFANLTIAVPSDIDLTDFDRRREAIAIGERIGQTYVDSIMTTIGAHP